MRRCIPPDKKTEQKKTHIYIYISLSLCGKLVPDTAAANVLCVEGFTAAAAPATVIAAIAFILYTSREYQGNHRRRSEHKVALGIYN